MAFPIFGELSSLQLLLEVGGIVLLFTLLAYIAERAGYFINRFSKSVIVFCSIVLYLKYRVCPPMPFSVFITYTTVILLAILLWASSSEEYWREFKQPILDTLDAETSATRFVRAAVVLLVPFLAGWFTWNAMQVRIVEPVELRTIIPAPRPTFRAFGKEFVTLELKNPFRVNDHGQYDQKYTDALSAEEGGAGLMRPKANPWGADISGYLKSVQDGGTIYFQNCVFCHGANLNARGPQNYASNPIATNFMQIRTILYIDEGQSFWRTAGGGPVIPLEGFPWASVMPPMEEHLTIDEIWKVLLFKSWFTGGDPAWVYQWRE